MQPEEQLNQPGRQPRPRSRASIDGVGAVRADYVSRASIHPQPVNRVTPVTSITVQSEPAPQPVVPQAEVPVYATLAVQQPEPAALASTAVEEPVTPAPIPVQPLAAPEVPTTKPEPKILDFTPPTERQKKPRFSKLRAKIHKPNTSVSKKLVAVSVVLIALIGAGSGVAVMANSQDPDAQMLRTALTNALNVTQVRITSSDKSVISYDYSNQQNPIVSGQTTVRLAGLPATVSGYGDSKNSYVAYTALPVATPSATAKQTLDSWVQLRTNGVAPVGVPAKLAHAADPRYQLFGPVLFGNLPQDSRQQITSYLISNTVYDYAPKKSVSDKLNGQSVSRFDVHINTSNLKIASQSYAAASGLNSGDIQDAMTALGEYRGANVSLYISHKTKQIVRTSITKAGQTTTFDYDNFNTALTATQPQTKLNWQSFAGNQFQLSAQTAAKQPAAQVDVIRKNQLDSLRSAFKIYQSQTGSFPSLANLNDPAWVAANLPGVDSDYLRDPLASSQTVLAAPKPGAIAYQVLDGIGKPGCDNTALNPCVQYKLIAVLSTNQQYVVSQP